jgi:2,4-dienoyl-CoA reductase-like NADH-dependent reductase (Old Yellow Enzyme family)
MVISEGLAIDHPAAIHHPAVPDINSPEALAMWRSIAADVQAAGAAFVAQLWHTGGARTKYEDVVNPEVPSISASGVYFPGKPYGEPLNEAEIEAAVLSYGRAARAAMAAGCDGINIHGAHGYLIDSFLWRDTNVRGDGYGAANRTRFAAEVIAECRRQTRPDFPIMLRFSQFKEQAYDAKLAETPGELEAFLEPLVEAGVDIFDCSTRRFWMPEFEGSVLNLAAWTRKLSGVPTMAVGSVGLDNDVISSQHQVLSSGVASLDKLEAMLSRGDFDLVGIGRALISDPEWVQGGAGTAERAERLRRGGSGRAGLALVRKIRLIPSRLNRVRRHPAVADGVDSLALVDHRARRDPPFAVAAFQPVDVADVDDEVACRGLSGVG